tara:strand:+ start:1622 stop:1891 length:270 start_codon:yes stop_codon:yes gene_type:complete
MNKNRRHKRNAIKHKTFIRNLDWTKKCRHCKEPLSHADKSSGVTVHVECSIEAYLKKGYIETYTNNLHKTDKEKLIDYEATNKKHYGYK